MIPEPHVCSECKKMVVMTDCLPAVCYLCKAKERRELDVKEEKPEQETA